MKNVRTKRSDRIIALRNDSDLLMALAERIQDDLDVLCEAMNEYATAVFDDESEILNQAHELFEVSRESYDFALGGMYKYGFEVLEGSND